MSPLRFSFPKLRRSSIHPARPRIFHQHRKFKISTSQFASTFHKYRSEIIPILTIITMLATWQSQRSGTREVNNLWAHVNWLKGEIQILKAQLEEALEETEEETEEDFVTHLFQDSSEGSGEKAR